MTIKTICNPVNINYQYQAGMCSRESADPAVVIYKDEYYLFASRGSGYWVSPDLADWEFIQVDTVKNPEFDLYAPGPVVVGDRMYLTHSQGGCMLYSDNPRDPDSWVNIGRPAVWGDPALFVDNGNFYVFEGLSPTDPLRVLRLNMDEQMSVAEGPVDIFWTDPQNRGYERRGNCFEDESSPYLEGSWVNRINGRYYLTYAVPGTEFDVYSDGCAVADAPMGPYTYCPNSPVAFKATGFMRGSGHGCLFADKKGNYWKMDTVSISVNHIFERRLCLFPAKIGEDGLLYTNTYRGDYPMILPHDTEDPFNQADAGWHLLSCGKTARASSVLDDSHTPDLAFDERMSSWWSARTGDAGEWLEVDLGKVYEVCSMQINFADQDIRHHTHGRGLGFSYKYTVEASEGGENWFMLIDQRDSNEDRSHGYFQLNDVTLIRYIRLSNCGETPAGGKFSVSGLRVFGFGGGDAPAKAPDFRVVRCEDARNMKVIWEPVEGAQGYMIRFGVHPNQLHTHWQVMDACEANIGCLTRNVTYYVTVDAYNESGITRGTDLQII